MTSSNHGTQYHRYTDDDDNVYHNTNMYAHHKQDEIEKHRDISDVLGYEPLSNTCSNLLCSCFILVFGCVCGIWIFVWPPMNDVVYINEDLMIKSIYVYIGVYVMIVWCVIQSIRGIYAFYNPLPSSVRQLTKREKVLWGLVPNDDGMDMNTPPLTIRKRRSQQHRNGHRRGASERTTSRTVSMLKSPVVSTPPPRTPPIRSIGNTSGGRHSRDHSINDVATLQRFSRNYQAVQSQRQQHSMVSNITTTPPPLYTSSPTYTTSYRDSPSNTNLSLSQGVVVDGPNADSFYTEEADKLLRLLRIEHKIEQWEEDIRQWFAQVVVQSRVRAFARSDEYMLNSAHQLLLQGGALLPRNIRALFASQTCSQELVECLIENFPQHKGMKDRQSLNRCLDAASISDREYVLHRLRTLAQDDYLSQFQWNGGGAWNGQRWSPHLPTDTQILFHVFTGFMTTEIIEDFDMVHTRVYSTKSGFKNDDTVVLLQLRADPPYFIVTHGLNTRWLPHPGRVNFFRAMALFFYYIKSQMGSHLRRISLSDTSLGGVHTIFGSDDDTPGSRRVLR